MRAPILSRVVAPLLLAPLALSLTATFGSDAAQAQSNRRKASGESNKAQVQSSPVVAQTPQSILSDIARSASADRIGQDLEILVGFGTRHTLSDTLSETRGIGAARRWIFDEFKQISAECGGCLEVFYVSGTVSGEQRVPRPVEIVNVIAVQRGKLDPDRVVMMSGDIDSRVTDVMDYTSDSPGANDNATGIAGTLEAARMLTKHTFPGTIVYAALSGEEQGLFGGEILAAWAKEQGWRIKGVLNNDMIGNIRGINGVVDNRTVRVFSEGTRAVETEREARMRRFTGGEVDSPSRNLGRYVDEIGESVIDNIDVMMVYRLDRFGRGGHHRPFNEAGMPAVRVMEAWENYDMQHQDLREENGIRYGDTLDGVDLPYAAKVTALNAVVMASMSWAPAPPANVRILGAVQPSTTLIWDALDASKNPQLLGYEVVWRLTDQPQWQWSRFVGNISEYTLENIVIDNYYFGVRSVSVDGFRSPVVFPGPAGSFGE